MIGHMFDHDEALFGIQKVEGVMASYGNDEGRATTLFELYLHDSHSDVSDAVEREGVWIPLTTLHWKEIRDGLELDVQRPEDIGVEQVEQYVRGGAYERLVSASTI